MTDTLITTVSGWRAKDVAHYAGISYRQLDHWSRKGYITPGVIDGKGSGTRRLYSSDNIRHILVMASVATLGVRFHVVKRFADFCIERLRDDKPLTGYFVCDGTTVHHYRSWDECGRKMMNAAVCIVDAAEVERRFQFICSEYASQMVTVVVAE